MSIHPSRQAYVEEEKEDTSIDLSSVPVDSNYAIPAAGPGQQSQQASSILNDFRRKREVAAIAVPTDDKRVQTELRARGEPITLFGERPEDRRDRLRELLYGLKGNEDAIMQDAGMGGDAGEDDEEVGEFYTEGPQELLEARKDMGRYSLPRAAKRVAYQKQEATIPVATHVAHRKAIKGKLSEYELYASQIASERPVAMVRFAPNDQILACGDWGGSIKILDLPNLETQTTLRGHKQMIGGIAWHPQNHPQTSKDEPRSSLVQLASGGGEGDINLWAPFTQDTPLATLSGHSARVCKTEFHPSGSYLASASHDTTWRLWDLQTTTELLLQEGHSKEVHAVSFNLDGSLLASAGLDSIGRIWDLRTGRTVMLLESHVAPIYALSWSVDGVRCMTGSSDGFAKCWDLRAVRETASIGAHRGGVADLRWYQGTDHALASSASQSADVTMTNGDGEGDAVQPKKSGTFIVSAGFDKAVNIFSADDWALCKSLTGHDGTVLGCDVASDARWIASCGRDRTVKVWGRGEGEGI